MQPPIGAIATLAVGVEPVAGYRLVDKIGHWHGATWRASRLADGCECALEFIQLDDKNKDRLISLFDRFRTVQHRCLLEISFVERMSDGVVVATPMVDYGNNAANRLREIRKQRECGIDPDELLPYMEAAAEGIDFLNGQCAYAHGNISPENMLLVGGAVKLARYGYPDAIDVANDNNWAGGIVAQGYLPPERCHGDAATARGDQFALAITYTELRTGRNPLLPNRFETMLGVKEPDLSPLAPRERAVVARAVHGQPDQRWSSCREFVAELSQALAHNTSSGLGSDAPVATVIDLRNNDAAFRTLLDLLAPPCGPKPEIAADKLHRPLELNEWAQEYYLKPRPEETKRILAGLRPTGILTDPDNRWQLLGFFSELFANHSDRLMEFLDELLLFNPGQQKFLLEAVWYSGTKEAKRILDKFSTAWLQEICGSDLSAADPPNRDDIPVSHPAILDFYWSRFFVTGAATHVRKIIACLQAAETASDLANGKPAVTATAIGTAARWSLTANARRHQRVHEICREALLSFSGDLGRLLQQIMREVENEGAPLYAMQETTTSNSRGRRTLDLTNSMQTLLGDRDLLNTLIGGYPTQIKNDEEARATRALWEKALGRARQFVKALPGVSAPRVVLADLLRMGHNMDVPAAAEECVQLLQEVLAAEPRNAEAHYTLASFYVSVDAQAAPFAEQHFLETIRLLGSKVRPDAYQGLGFACLYQNRTEEGIRYFEDYLRLVGEVPRIRELVNKLRGGAPTKVSFIPCKEPKAKRP